MSLGTPKSVQKLQWALHAKAKECPNYRFYSLYDKIYRTDVIATAYRQCYRNGGSAGVDGVTFDDIDAYGRGRWLGELVEDLRKKTYVPSAVLRGYMPKRSGGRRSLGIPTIRDRVVQMAFVLVLDPIFEADLPSEQFAYRKGRSALDAVNRAHRLLYKGYTEVIDADLRDYFNVIPHAELMKSLSRRICDRAVLGLIKKWLQAPVEKRDTRGRGHRTTRHKDEGRGTPQGSPLSPLLSNLYMRRFILGWKVLGYEKRLDAKIVSYADDVMICCRGSSAAAMVAMRHLLERLKLELNESKTCIRHIPMESVDFLGYTLGLNWSPRTGRSYIGSRPSKSRVQGICREISTITSRRWYWRSGEEQVALMNQKMLGWANYFRLGSVSSAYRAIDRHSLHRLRKWLKGKHKLQVKGTARYPDKYLIGTLGLVRLGPLTSSFPWAKA